MNRVENIASVTALALFTLIFMLVCVWIATRKDKKQ